MRFATWLVRVEIFGLERPHNPFIIYDCVGMASRYGIEA